MLLKKLEISSMYELFIVNIPQKKIKNSEVEDNEKRSIKLIFVK